MATPQRHMDPPPVSFDTLSSEAREVLDAVSEPVLLCDVDCIPLYKNKAFNEVRSGSSTGEDSSGPVGSAVLMGALPLLQQTFKDTLDQRAVPPKPLRFDEGPGGRVFEIDCKRWLRHDGSIAGILATFRDVTSRQLAGTQLHVTREELVQMKYHISHDLRAPITSVRGLLGLIDEDLKSGSSDDVPEMIEETMAQLKRLESLITDLMSLARAGQSRLEPVDVDVRELLDEIVASISLHERELEVSVSLSSVVPILKTDRTRLRQILANLISNARKFRDPDEPAPCIHVDVAERDGNWRITVMDNGIGMTKTVAERAFDSFARGGTGHEGHGLGLHIVLKHVDNLGGCVRVAGLGKPTTIEVLLPQAPQQAGHCGN